MTDWLPLLTLAAVLAAGLLADRLVARGSPDRGTYWSKVVLLALPVSMLALFASWLLEVTAPDWWARGLHLMPDLALAPSFAAELIALGLPVLLWLLVLAAAAALPHDDPADGRWLAGSVGLRPSRLWLLLFPVVPLAVLAAVAVPRLAASQAPQYPGGVWSLLVVAAVSLAFIAVSKGRPPSPCPPPAPKVPQLPDWPQVLRDAGIALDTLATFAPVEAQDGDSTAAAVPGDGRPDMARRLIPPRLWAALEGGAGNRLIMAPEHAGQLECVARLAEQQMVAGNEATLVVVPDRLDDVALALRRWLPDDDAAEALHPELRADSPAFLWLADAKGLSDRWIPLLEAQPALLHRIGTLVWWDLHQYSGVLAANFWAISHRFQRLLDRRSRRDIRHVAFVRGEPSSDTQLTPFLNLCLPRKFPPETQTVLAADCVGATSVHLLSGIADKPAGDAGDARTVPNDRPVMDTALATARASARAGWPTCLRAPAHLDAQELRHFGQYAVGAETLAQALRGCPPEAGAYVLEVGTADVLALHDLIAQVGRMLPHLPQRHIGVMASFGNPYVEWLLRRTAADPGLLRRARRRMVAAEPQPGVIGRHLLLALDELPATLSGLNKTFRWERTGEVRQTLRRLAEQNKILRRDVRYLVEDQGEDRLEVEVEYRSILARDRAPPLTTLGSDLVEVFDPGTGPVLRVDPERVTIAAYPSRTFVSEGRRYRIEQWESIASITGSDGRMRVDCRREDGVVKTWRIFSPRLGNTRGIAGKKDIRIAGLDLTRVLVTTDYQERISGYLSFRQEAASGRWHEDKTPRFPANSILSPVLSTRGLLLEVPKHCVDGAPLGLHSLAQALRHVFPVHVGVDEDAVAILALRGKPVDERPAWGIMIVDLYPGGIGLIQSMDDDPALLVRLLELSRDWLAGCSCNDERGCPSCLQSPIARSAIADNVTMGVSRRQALDVLERVLRRQS